MKQNKDSESWPKAIKGISLKFNRKRNASICGTHPACLEKKKEQIYTSSPTKIVVKPSATWPESMTIAASLQINQVNIENKI